jgi:anaerobic selenocysteine-containing dehydrogenase
MTVIAVGPRRIETANFADLHLPIRPGTDIALLNSMLCVLIEQNLIEPFRACTLAGGPWVSAKPLLS